MEKATRHGQERALKEQYNKIRGIIADFRSSRFVIGSRGDRLAQFNSALNRIFLETQYKTNSSSYDVFLSWVKTQTSNQLPFLNRYPALHGSFYNIHNDINIPPLDNQIYWIALRLNQETKKIEKFIELKQLIEESIIAGEYETSINVNSGEKLSQRGCGHFLGLIYVVNPRLSRYSIGLR